LSKEIIGLLMIIKGTNPVWRFQESDRSL